eukprot:Gb_33123 [translate_table: standard]
MQAFCFRYSQLLLQTGIFEAFIIVFMEMPLEVTQKRCWIDTGEDLNVAKRCHSILSSLYEFLCKDDSEDEGFTGESADTGQEELILGVMKRLGEEIRWSCSYPTKSEDIDECSTSDGDGRSPHKTKSEDGLEDCVSTESLWNATSSKSLSVSDDGCSMDVAYLFGATDDELGIPSSPHIYSQTLSVEDIGDMFLDNIEEQDIFENLCVNPDDSELILQTWMIHGQNPTGSEEHTMQ